MSGCVIVSNGCVDCPAVPPIIAVPPSQTFIPMLGWNSGADSADTIDDEDLHVVFTQAAVTSVINGLKSQRRGVGIPQLVDYAFGFHQSQAQPFFYVVELGVQKRADMPYVAGDTFEIRRAGSIIQYYYTPASTGTNRLIYTSQASSVGPLIVSACLYASGDSTG